MLNCSSGSASASTTSRDKIEKFEPSNPKIVTYPGFDDLPFHGFQSEEIEILKENIQKRRKCIINEIEKINLFHGFLPEELDESKNVLGLIPKICIQLNLSDSIKSRANNLLLGLESSKFRLRNSPKINDYSKKELIFACLFVACREEGLPRSFREIEMVSSIKKGSISRCVSLVMDCIHSGMNEEIWPQEYVERLCIDLKLTEDVKNCANTICQKVAKFNPCGILKSRAPIAICSAAIYIASQAFAESNSLTKKDISGRYYTK